MRETINIVFFYIKYKRDQTLDKSMGDEKEEI